MLKKLSAILILIAMTAALAGCGNDKDSSSKNESSATTEAITEEITEEETETLTLSSYCPATVRCCFWQISPAYRLRSISGI